MRANRLRSCRAFSKLRSLHSLALDAAQLPGFHCSYGHLCPDGPGFSLDSKTPTIPRTYTVNTQIAVVVSRKSSRYSQMRDTEVVSSAPSRTFPDSLVFWYRSQSIAVIEGLTTFQQT